MFQKILQINYKFGGSRAELEQAYFSYAKPIADTPGLRWKVWLVNEQQAEAGGIHLFDDEATLQAYLAGPVVTELKKDPTVSIKVFDVMEKHTAFTRGTVKQPSGSIGRGS